MAQVVIITLESNGSSVHRTTTWDGSEVQVRIGHKGKLSFFVSPRTETPFLWVPGLSSSAQRHDLVRALGTYKEGFTTTSTCTARVLCPTARDPSFPHLEDYMKRQPGDIPPNPAPVRSCWSPVIYLKNNG